MEKSSMSLRSILKAVHSSWKLSGSAAYKPPIRLPTLVPMIILNGYLLLLQHPEHPHVGKAFRGSPPEDKGDDGLFLYRLDDRRRHLHFCGFCGSAGRGGAVWQEKRQKRENIASKTLLVSL